MIKSMTKALRTGCTHAARELRIFRIDDSLRTCAMKKKNNRREKETIEILKFDFKHPRYSTRFSG
jgi:hypothetical protein